MDKVTVPYTWEHPCIESQRAAESTNNVVRCRPLPCNRIRVGSICIGSPEIAKQRGAYPVYRHDAVTCCNPLMLPPSMGSGDGGNTARQMFFIGQVH